MNDRATHPAALAILMALGCSILALLAWRYITPGTAQQLAATTVASLAGIGFGIRAWRLTPARFDRNR